MGAVYATMEQASRHKVKEWAQEAYPREWKEVQKKLEGVPEDCPMNEMLEQLEIGQLRRVGLQNRQAVLALQEQGIKQLAPKPTGDWTW